jgi:DinB family protein
VTTECDRIADQFYRGVEGDAWLGPPVRALLADVTAEMAAARPIPNAHTIWELVLHMTAWAEIARRGVAGEVVEPTPAEDWPASAPPSAAAWNEAVAALERSHGELRRAALALGESHLEDRTPGKPHTLYVQLHGVLQHTLYHAGQIAILKRAAAK